MPITFKLLLSHFVLVFSFRSRCFHASTLFSFDIRHSPERGNEHTRRLGSKQQQIKKTTKKQENMFSGPLPKPTNKHSTKKRLFPTKIFTGRQRRVSFFLIKNILHRALVSDTHTHIQDFLFVHKREHNLHTRTTAICRFSPAPFFLACLVLSLTRPTIGPKYIFFFYVGTQTTKPQERWRSPPSCWLQTFRLPHRGR